MVVTGAEVVKYSSISVTAATITASGKIEVVQDRILTMCNQHFTTDMYLQGAVTFAATARTIVSTNSFVTAGFIATDDIYVRGSYRNDDVYTISSVTTVTLTLTTAASVVDEISGRSIFISVIKWPLAIKQTAALMVEYDTDNRSNNSEGLKSQSLGPWSESYSTNQWGYPDEMLSGLDGHIFANVI